MNGVSNENNLVSDAYFLDHLLLKEEPQRKINFLSSIRTNLVNLHYDKVWNNQHSYAAKKVSDMIKIKLKNNFKSAWKHTLAQRNENNKLRCYKELNKDFGLENYLLYFKNNLMCRISLTKIRLSAHNLHIETERYKRHKKTPFEERLCSYCLSLNIDEIYIMF